MGVKQCDRHGCIVVLCDRYSSVYGYICTDCFNELVSLGPETNVADFLSTEKKYINTEAAYARFNVEFPLHD